MIYRCLTWDGPLFSVPVSPSEFRKVLKRLGLSQSEASRRLYVTVTTVQRWVRGARKVPGPAIAALEAWQRQAKAEEALKRVKDALNK
ncbi:MAG: helix-turn-helix domain-containing protein [Gemmatimonadetes bacterium]|nr:helix-turn-helix domain-containing protein [Gemmatimonadota bacterium]